MSKKPARPGNGGGASFAQRRGWALDPDQAQAAIAGARKALFVMVGVLAVIWIIQIVNAVDQYQLSQDYGIRPRDLSTLPYILTAPFLHFSWTHIEGNSGPLFIFGFLAAYRGIARFAGVTAVVILTSGLAAWFFEGPRSVGAGASGVVFGYFGYIMVRGLFDRHAIDVLVGAVMALCFAYQFSVLLPHQGIGWQAHVGGLVGGIASGWLFRERRAAQSRRTVSGAASADQKVAAGTGTGVAIRPASAGSQGTTVGTSDQGRRVTQSAKPAKSGKPGKTGKGFAVDPANPRADLYKELDDLGL